jgi:hypothetical protein
MLGRFHHVAAALIGAAAFAGSFAVAAAAPAVAPSPQATLESLAGTWTCVTQFPGNKSWQETQVGTMYGKWLKIDATYPAQAGVPAGTSLTFVGYDTAHSHWVVTGVGTDGVYFTASSNSPAYDGSTWTDTYPADNGTATIHMPSAAAYTMDATGPGLDGKVETSHTACTRQ